MNSTVGPPAIELHGVTKHYKGGGGVDELTLRVERGEIFGYLGPNGAGKSTTIRMLVDLIRPDVGTISVLGLDARRDSIEVHRRIGYLPGELTLYERLSAREILGHFAHLRGLDAEAYESLAGRLHLQLDRVVRELSKGNRQKVGLIQALMGDPELLILDEPTSGLDPLIQHEVHDELRRAASEGRTVLLSSHVLSEVAEIADRVGIIREGRLIAVEQVDEFRQRAIHLVDATFASPPTPEVRGALEAAGGTFETSHKVHLEIPSERLSELVKVLSGAEVVDLWVREPALQELFLSLYEHGEA